MTTPHPALFLVLLGLMAVGGCLLASPDPVTADAAATRDILLDVLDTALEAI